MKKLFAILMSIMMIACFMPTMAFAAEYTGTISAPVADNSVAGQVTLTAATLNPSDEAATVEYGYSETNESAGITNWQTSLVFNNLTEGKTYYFFARVKDKQGDGGYDAKVSEATTVKVKSTPTYDVPTGLKATYGAKLSTVVLPTVEANENGKTAGAWSWVTEDGTEPTVGSVGENQFNAKFTPEDQDTYATKTVKITVAVAAATYTYEPSISGTVYVGNPYPTGGEAIATGVNNDNVTGTLAWFTDEECNTAANGKFTASEQPITLYWKFTTENTNYTPAEKRGSKAFTVTAKNQVTVVFANAESKPYTADGYTLGEQFTAASVDGKDAKNIHYVYNSGDSKSSLTDLTDKVTEVGTYEVTAIYDDEDSHGEAKATFGITKATGSIAIQNAATLNKMYDRNAVVTTGLTVDKGSSTGDVEYKFYADNEGAPSDTEMASAPSKAGTYWIKAFLALDDHYDAAVSNAVSFTISPAELTMTATVLPKEYDGTAAATILAGDKLTGIIDGDKVSILEESIQGTFENQYVGIDKGVTPTGEFTLTGADAANYTVKQPTSLTGQITAVEQNPTIIPTAAVKTDTTFDLSKLVTGVKGDADVTFTITGEAPEGTSINKNTLTAGNKEGTVKITVAVAAKDLNSDDNPEYEAYTGTKAITVTVNGKEMQSALSISNDPKKVTYGEPLTLETSGGDGDGAVTYAILSGGTGEAEINGAVLTPKKAGTVIVRATKAGDATHNEMVSDPVIFTIEKATHAAVNHKETAKQGEAYQLDFTTKFNLLNFFCNEPQVSTGQDLFAKQPKFDSETGYLTFQFKDDAKVGETATITVKVNESANYNEFIVTIEVTVAQKSSGSGGSYYPYTPSTPSKPSAPNLDKTKTDSTTAINAAATANKYDAAEQAEVKNILDKANADIKNAKTEAEVKAIQEAAQAEIDKILTTEEKATVAALDNVEKRDFATKSKVITRKGGKKVIRLTWTAPDGVDVDGYEIFRSTKKNSGFGKKPYFTTSNTSYTNTKALKAGKSYYYKVRAFVVINGERVYTDYSLKAYRKL